MKYIIYDEEKILIFDESLTHQNAAFIYNLLSTRISSAGKIILDPDLGLKCYGESITLNKKSLLEDINIIKHHLKP